MLPRHDFFTKEIYRLLQGGVNGLTSQSSESEGWSQSPSGALGAAGAEIGVPDRLRSGDLLHERQACCLDYTTRTEMERVNGIAPSSRPWHGRILLLNHTRKNGVPSRTLTDNLTLRTRRLCALSYEDKRSNPWPVSFTG